MRLFEKWQMIDREPGEIVNLLTDQNAAHHISIRNIAREISKERELYKVINKKVFYLSVQMKY